MIRYDGEADFEYQAACFFLRNQIDAMKSRCEVARNDINWIRQLPAVSELSDPDSKQKFVDQATKFVQEIDEMKKYLEEIVNLINMAQLDEGNYKFFVNSPCPVQFNIVKSRIQPGFRLRRSELIPELIFHFCQQLTH